MTEIDAGADAWIEEANPAANHVQTGALFLNGTAGSERRSFLFFPRPFPLGATIFVATLRFYLFPAWPGANVVTARRITGFWIERAIKWTNQPATTATHAATADVNDAPVGAEVEIDVTDMMGDVSAGGDWFGIRLTNATNAVRSLVASENPNRELRPVLEVRWGIPPDPPVNLIPQGGAAVSVALPILDWQFSSRDLNAQRRQAHSQVQIADSPDFSTTEYDSGKTANVITNWDLSETAYGGLTTAETRWWRVRIWDDRGLVSGWSDAVTMTRQGKGTVEITNPGAAPNDFVEETTPPIAWNFTGVQRSAEIVLFRKRNSKWRRIWIWPETVTNDTSHAVPHGLIKTGSEYMVKVRIWDDVDRNVTTGDADYAEDVRTFTYQRAGGPTPVSDLDAEGQGPKIVLTWTRATMPDYFSLRVNGVEVLDRIDPNEVLVSGDAYRLDYWRAIDHEVTTFEVEAVVQDLGKLKHSQGNATVGAISRVGGKWLVDDDPAEPLAVQIADASQPSFQIGETATMYDLPGTQRPVRIADSVRGYEGSFSGTLRSTVDKATFEELKRRQKPLRYVQQKLNIPVRLGETSISPRSSTSDRDWWLVTAELYQVDEFPDDGLP